MKVMLKFWLKSQTFNITGVKVVHFAIVLKCQHTSSFAALITARSNSWDVTEGVTGRAVTIKHTCSTRFISTQNVWTLFPDRLRLKSNSAHCVMRATIRPQKVKRKSTPRRPDWLCSAKWNSWVFLHQHSGTFWIPGRRQGRLGGLRILTGQLKPFGAGPY